MAPVVRQAGEITRQIVAPTMSSTTSDAAAPRSVACISATKSCFAIVDRERRAQFLGPSAFVIAADRDDHPRAEQIAEPIAVVPIPLDPPWTRKRLTLAAPPRSNTLVHTVKSVSGSAAASTIVEPFRHRQALPAGAAQYSA